MLRDTNTEALIHDGGEEIVVPGKPVLGGESFGGQSHHFGVAGADTGLLPDDTQRSQDLLTARAGGADDAKRTGIHVVAHAHTCTNVQTETVLHRAADPHFDRVGTGGIDIGDAEALIHGNCIRIVIPGVPVLRGELLQRHAHHLRVTRAETRLLPDDPQGGDDLLVAGAGGADNTHWTIVHVVAHSGTGSNCKSDRVYRSHTIAYPDLNGVCVGGIHIGNAETLIH